MNIVFDWAGTLADDFELTWRLTNETIRFFGIEPVSIETYRTEFKSPAASFYEKFCPGIPWNDIENTFSEICRKRYPNRVTLWPGVREGLLCLGHKHKLFLLSTLDQAMLEETLRVLDLTSIFQKVEGSKPDKTLALPKMIADLKLSLDETVFIGDSVHDIEAAKVASIAPLAVGYGYAGETLLVSAEPDLIFKSVQEMMRYLDKLAFAESRYFPVATVGGLIFDDQGWVLLVRTRKWSNLYGVPGGKVDYGETLENAFVREIREETGLILKDIQFGMNQDCIEHPQFYRPRHYILVNYFARTEGKKPTVKLNHEADDFVWVEPEKALALPLNEPTRILMEKFLEKR